MSFILSLMNSGVVHLLLHWQVAMRFSDFNRTVSIEASPFFKEGLQQMDVTGYPESMREVVGCWKYFALMRKNFHRRGAEVAKNAEKNFLIIKFY